MTYAIISLGGKQYRVQEGDRLVVDRLGEAEGKTFNPPILFVGGDGKAELGPKGTTVTAKVVGHVLGDKIRVGKYRRRTGYSRHTGHRSRLTEVEIQSIGRKTERAAAKKADEKPAAKRPLRASGPGEGAPGEPGGSPAKAEAKSPKTTAKRKPAAKKPAAAKKKES
ncbi:MAG TPA: 50S ribosomal protein L21 [Gaiellaceae bacterium]|jgi:large subunit ribosomal protein L21|nr:50S ribosomal protein L21 [Gaiellaceae bacterium]